MQNPPGSRAKGSPVRAIVVDDSPTVRELLVTILQGARGIQVVGVGSNGEDAIQLTGRLRPDVVVLDVRMPRMDGLEATRRIMREIPTPIVVVTGSLIHSEVDVSFEALRAGALSVLLTPSVADQEGQRRLVQTVRLMAEVPVVHHWGWKDRPGAAANVAPAPRLAVRADERAVQVIGMAASTGGPAALTTVFGDLPANFPIPIVVVQHITRGFTAGLVDWLGTETRLRVAVAQQGDMLQAGTVLFAPEDYHLEVSARGRVELTRHGPYKGLRPSANYLFRSLAASYGRLACGLVLTGMGDDGADGLEALRRVGGLTIAQDEQSCVVYGMPREAISRNAAERVVPLDQIAQMLRGLAADRRPEGAVDE